MTDDTITRVLAMRRDRMSCREIAAALFYTRSYISLTLRKYAPELLNIGLPQGRHSTRPAQATALRATGMTWREITERLGYSDEGCAILAVRRYTGRPAMRRGQHCRLSA